MAGGFASIYNREAHKLQGQRAKKLKNLTEKPTTTKKNLKSRANNHEANEPAAVRPSELEAVKASEPKFKPENY